jgi:hypothetical protein
MNLGLAIFLSSIIVSLTILYINTKDTWSWRKIWKWTGILLLIVIIFFAGLIVFHNITYKNSQDINFVPDKPFVNSTVLGISLGNTKEDVDNLYGKPSRTTDSAWIYEGDKIKEGTKGIFIYNKNGNVIAAIAFGKTGGFQYLFEGNKSQIKTSYGEPIHKYNSGNLYIWEYPKNKSMYFFEDNKTIGIGIYEPKEMGDKEFRFRY